MDLKRIYDEANQTSHDSGLQAIFAAGVDEGRRQVMVEVNKPQAELVAEEVLAQVESNVKAKADPTLPGQPEASPDEAGDKKSPWPGDVSV